MKRHILLRAYVDVQRADYQQQGGHDHYLNAGVGVSWLFNRNMRLSATYDYGTRRPTAGLPISESIALLKLRFAM